MKRIGQVVLPLQVLQQVEDLRLHRDVERGDDLVAHQQLGLEHQGPGDADALALAARELAGPPRAVDVGVDPDLVEHGAATSRPAPPWMPIFQMVSGSDTMSMTRRRGFSEEIGSWKIICTCVRSVRRSPRLSDVSSVSPNTILPEVAFSTWTMARPVVDLPQPDSPTSPSVSPWRRLKVMPATACTVALPRPKETWRSSTESSGSVATAEGSTRGVGHAGTGSGWGGDGQRVPSSSGGTSRRSCGPVPPPPTAASPGGTSPARRGSGARRGSPTAG